MKFIIPALVAALGVSLPAQASDSFYAGASVTKAGTINFAPGISSDNRHLSVAGYGGYNFNDGFAIEAGYIEPGSFRAPDQGPRYKLDASAFYVAAKGTVRFGEKWSMAGKVGLARNSYELSTPTGNAEVRSNRIMYGIGVAYQLSAKVALTLELENFGKTNAPNFRLSHRRLAVGMRYAF